MNDPNKVRKPAPFEPQNAADEETHPLPLRPDNTLDVKESPQDATPRLRFGPPAAADEVGTLGRFRVKREIGHGGMGAVFLTFDTQLHRQIALKVMLPHLAANPTTRDRFIREARSAAQISHDNVLGILDAGEIDGVPFIAMPYLQGYSLDQFLRKKGNPAVPQVMRIGREMALGLAAAHDLGVIHRDIKPGNVWLEAPNGRVKILDFGLAKPPEELVPGKELTHTGQIMGTPAYMAPEQAAGLKVDHRADLYSLGAVLYKLLSGRTPFEQTDLMAMLVALAVEEPKPIRELNPFVSPALADLIHELLRKDRDARPQSGKDVAKRMVAMLRRSASGESDSAQIEVPPASAFHTPLQTPFVPIPISAPPAPATEPVAENLFLPEPSSLIGDRLGSTRKSRLLIYGVLLGSFLLIGTGAAIGSRMLWPAKDRSGEPRPSKKASADEGKAGPKAVGKPTPEPKAGSAAASNAEGWEDLFPAEESPFFRRRWDVVGNVRNLTNRGNTVLVDGSGYAWIRTKKQYADFELELEYKPTAKANSGIFLRAPADDNVDLTKLFEVQLYDDAASPDFRPNMLTGSLYNRVTRRADPKARLDDWNTVTVKVVGQYVTATINGVTCLDDGLPSLPDTGHLGLQAQATGLEFRNVRVRELK